MPELGGLGNVLRVVLEIFLDTENHSNPMLLGIKARFSRIPR